MKRKARSARVEMGNQIKEPKFAVYFVVILALIFAVPLIVLPYVIDNAFNTPKTLVMYFGATILVFYYGIQYLRGRAIPVPAGYMKKLVLILILFNIISMIYTRNPFYTLKAAYLNITCLVLFCCVSFVARGKCAQLLLAAVAGSGLLVSAVAWLQFFYDFDLFRLTESQQSEPWVTVVGTLGNSNYLGAYLVFVLYSLAGLFWLHPGKRRLFSGLLFVFVLGALFMCRARSAWLGFFISLPLFFYFVKDILEISFASQFRSRGWFASILAVPLLIVFIGFQCYDSPKSRAASYWQMLSGTETVRVRFAKQCRTSWWLFKQSPLIGTGLWSFRNQVYEAQAKINENEGDFFDDYPEPKPRRVHNDYLEALNDGGLIGTLVIVFFLVTVLRHGWLILRDKSNGNQKRIVVAACFCAMISTLLIAIFFFPFRLNRTMIMTIMMLGIMEGAYLESNGIVHKPANRKLTTRAVLVVPLLFFVLGFSWQSVILPFLGEIEHYKFKTALVRGDNQAAEQYILKALEYDPKNTSYQFFACQRSLARDDGLKDAVELSDKVLEGNNGDVTMWAAWYLSGMSNFGSGRLLVARSAFEKACYYNPMFTQAADMLEETKSNIRTLINAR